MICKKCGNVIADDAQFCTFCGEAQNMGVDMDATQVLFEQQNYVAPEAPAEYQQMPQSEPAPAYEQPMYAEEPVTGKNGNGVAIASLVLGIISIAMLVLSFCCCGTYTGFISVVTAIVGMVLASSAKKKGMVGGAQKAGFILSLIALIISIVLIVISIVMTIVLVASGGFAAVMEEFEREVNRGAGVEAGISNGFYAVKPIFNLFK